MKLSKPLLTTTSHFAKASLVVINHSNAYIKKKKGILSTNDVFFATQSAEATSL